MLQISIKAKVHFKRNAYQKCTFIGWYHNHTLSIFLRILLCLSRPLKVLEVGGSCTCKGTPIKIKMVSRPLQCHSLESDAVKESLVANACVAAIWIIDPAFKHSSICCLVPLNSHNCFGCVTTSIMILFGFLQKIRTPALPSHLPIVELPVVARPVLPGKCALTMHFSLHKLSHISADQFHLVTVVYSV